MKKLGKTKHILIALAIVIIAVIIGLESFSEPDPNYVNNPVSTLEKLTGQKYLVALDELSEKEILVDVRSPYEFERGHIEGAINIPSAEIIYEETMDHLKELKKDDKCFALYGNTPEEANIPFLILYKLGCDNIKMLPVELSYDQNELIVNPVEIEKQAYDINSFIAESEKKAKAADDAAMKAAIRAAQPAPAPKKEVVVKKKKKRPPEGGC